MIVVGAGASFDCWGGIGYPEKEWRPPLTRDLFGLPNTIDALPNNTFQNILRTYPGAEKIAAALALPYRQGTIEFETELGRYADNPETQGDFMHVPPYIRDIIGGCSVRYGDRPGNYFSLISRLLNFGSYDICIVTTNYDTLIERELFRLNGLGFKNDRLEDYVSSPRVKLVKLHGSVNWFKTLCEIESGRTREHWFQAAEDYRFAELSDETYLMNDAEDEHNPVTSRQLAVNGRHFFVFPALTAPIADKGNSVVCPEDHVYELQQFIRDCGHLIVIGSSGVDADVFDNLHFGRLIERAAIVGGQDASTVLEKYRTRYRNLWDADQPIAWERGFGSFLGSQAFGEMFLDGT